LRELAAFFRHQSWLLGILLLMESKEGVGMGRVKGKRRKREEKREKDERLEEEKREGKATTPVSSRLI